jgi:hypothetical protein
VSIQFALSVRNAAGQAYYTAVHSVVEPARALCFVYFGPGEGGWSEPPETLELVESWKAEGVYLFAQPNDVLKNLDALIACIDLSKSSANRGVGWAHDLASNSPVVDFVAIHKSSNDAIVVTDRTEFSAYNVEWVVEKEVDIEFDPSTSSRFKFKMGRSDQGRLFFQRDNVTRPIPVTEYIDVELDPTIDGTAQFRFSSKWFVRELFALFQDDPYAIPPIWGGELRYAFKTQEGSGPLPLVFPLFEPPEATLALDFSIKFDPLEPGNSDCSAFMYPATESSIKAFTSNFGKTTDGVPVHLTPLSNLGFYLGRRPNAKNSSSVAAYLAPVGEFTLSSTKTPFRLMCGLSQQEFIQVKNGDLLTFVGDQPAFADLEDTERGLEALKNSGEAPILDDRFSTSWSVITTPPSNEQTPVYFGQSASGTLYSAAAISETHFAAASASRLGELSGDMKFPLALYGGIYPPTSSADKWPNKSVPSTEFLALEQSALATQRFRQISDRLGHGPLVCDEAGVPIGGGRSATPRGALLQMASGESSDDEAPVAPSGGWARLVLGESDAGEIGFGAGTTGEVDPILSQTLLNPESFLVLNDWVKFPEFVGRINVQNVVVDLAPLASSPTQRQTIMVFKYATGESLEAMIERIETWDRVGHFVGSAEQAETARTVMRNSIAQAKSQKDAPGKPFAYFLETILVDENWTGFIVFNAPLDGRDMPPDYQMILGGIDGQLRAHHFGVETNRLEVSDGQPAIKKTAFVGVFFHVELEPPPPLEAPYQYRTTKLIIEIRNAIIQQFATEVAVTIKQLFGRKVEGLGATLRSEPETVRLEGDYQVVDGVGRVIFAGAVNQAFGFNQAKTNVRVCERFTLSGASLTPISSVKVDRSGTLVSHIVASFSLGGELCFAKAPFPASSGNVPIDIFSYGVEDQNESWHGLPLSDLALDLAFDLGPNGREGEIAIAPNFADIQVSDKADNRRAGGLVSGLPLSLSGLLSGETALAAIKSTGKLLNVPDFLPDQNETAENLDADPVTVINATTQTPHYALSFTLPLGSLGDLSETGVGLSCGLILAWGPSAATPDEDGAALYVQLPGLVGGAGGIDLQGFLKTTFGEANLGRVNYTNDEGETVGIYVLMFNNVALSLFGIQLPPKVITDFVIFSNPSQPGQTDIAWSLAATQVSS